MRALSGSDPYKTPKQQKQTGPKWTDLTPAQKKAWSLYLRGKGPKPA